METIISDLESKLIYFDPSKNIIKDLVKFDVWTIKASSKEGLFLEHKALHNEPQKQDWYVSYDMLRALFRDKDSVAGKERFFIHGFSSYDASGQLVQDFEKLAQAIINTIKKIELDEANIKIDLEKQANAQKENRLKELEELNNKRQAKRTQRKEQLKKHSEEWDAKEEAQRQHQIKISTSTKKMKSQQQRIRLISID